MDENYLWSVSAWHALWCHFNSYRIRRRCALHIGHIVCNEIASGTFGSVQPQFQREKWRTAIRCPIIITFSSLRYPPTRHRSAVARNCWRWWRWCECAVRKSGVLARNGPKVNCFPHIYNLSNTHTHTHSIWDICSRRFNCFCCLKLKCRENHKRLIFRWSFWNNFKWILQSDSYALCLCELLN